LISQSRSWSKINNSH